MRRKDREVTDPAEIDAILAKARVVHLGLMDGGWPYVVALHYGYEWQLADGTSAAGPAEAGRLALYAHGARQGRKLDLVAADPHAFIEADCDVETLPGKVACDWGAAYASVMGRATVTLLEDPAEKVHGLELLMKGQTGRDFVISEKMAAGVGVLRITVERADLTAKRHPKPPASPATATA